MILTIPSHTVIYEMQYTFLLQQQNRDLRQQVLKLSSFSAILSESIPQTNHHISTLHQEQLRRIGNQNNLQLDKIKKQNHLLRDQIAVLHSDRNKDNATIMNYRQQINALKQKNEQLMNTNEECYRKIKLAQTMYECIKEEARKWQEISGRVQKEMTKLREYEVMYQEMKQQNTLYQQAINLLNKNHCLYVDENCNKIIQFQSQVQFAEKDKTIAQYRRENQNIKSKIRQIQDKYSLLQTDYNKNKYQLEKQKKSYKKICLELNAYKMQYERTKKNKSNKSLLRNENVKISSFHEENTPTSTLNCSRIQQKPSKCFIQIPQINKQILPLVTTPTFQSTLRKIFKK